MIMNEKIMEILRNSPPIEYIKVLIDLTFKDFSGRRTCIPAGEVGYLLNEEQICLLSKASAEYKAKMMEEMMGCFDRGAVYALVCGYPCKIMHGEFEVLDYIPNRCCGELI